MPQHTHSQTDTYTHIIISKHHHYDTASHNRLCTTVTGRISACAREAAPPEMKLFPHCFWQWKKVYSVFLNINNNAYMDYICSSGCICWRAALYSREIFWLNYNRVTRTALPTAAKNISKYMEMKYEILLIFPPMPRLPALCNISDQQRYFNQFFISL